MAFMNQERKKRINEILKPIMKKYGLKYSLSVHHHSTLICTIRSGAVNFFADQVPNEYTKVSADRGHANVNEFWIDKHWRGKSREALTEIRNVMNNGNHDRSDAMTDFFDVGWYIQISIGQWNKPYILAR